MTPLRAAFALAVIPLCAGCAAQAQETGQGEVALQGYYLGGDTPMSDITGIAANVKTYLPGAGVFTANIATYGATGRFRTGENYADLNGFTWYGLRWRATGGDFRISTALVPFPFTNIFLPDIGVEGVRVQAGNANRTYTAFYGIETLMAGPRVPFLVRVPQEIAGASVVQKAGEKLQFGARAMFLSSGVNASSTYLFAPGEDFRRDSVVSASALYKASEPLQLYAEIAASAANGSSAAPGSKGLLPLSFTAGPVWKTKKLAFRANYIHEAPSYLPVAGYFLGDRSGPYAELQVKPIDAVELFGSASDYRNNIQNSPDVPTYHSTSTSAGASVALPYRFSLSGQLSTANFSATQPGTGEMSKSLNQQIIAGLSKQLYRNNLRFAYRDIKIVSSGAYQAQRSGEIEDIVQFKRISLGGAVRDEKLAASQSKDTIFVRGTLQTQLGRFSAYAYVEHGDDLANKTVFATNTFNTTVFGAAVRLKRAWNMQLEASRNQLTTELNPENIFLLQNQGVFVSNAIAGLNQWTAYFRLSKSLHWGRGSIPGDLDGYAATQMPLVGVVQGVVRQEKLAGLEPAPNVPVALDDGEIATTDAAGVFVFPRVSEGHHRLSLAINRMPVEYDPGRVVEAFVEVKPRHQVDVDLTVVPLAFFTGRIEAPEGTAVESIVVRLLPGDRYTTPAPNGAFSFYNLHEGEYDVVLERKSLPQFSVLDRTAAHVSVQGGAAMEPVVFRMRIEKPEKPIHHSFDQK